MRKNYLRRLVLLSLLLFVIGLSGKVAPVQANGLFFVNSDTNFVRHTVFHLG